MHRFLAATLTAALLQAIGSHAATGSPASIATPSRWWTLDCREACVFTVRIRGALDASRLQLVRRALERRDRVARSLGREVALRADVDSQGGSVFAALEIGRLFRRERASLLVAENASCISACVFLLLGAVEREVGDGARVGIHRPSLGPPDRPQPAGVVDAMAGSLVLYAEQMHVPRAIVDEMMAIPSDRVELLRPSDLAAYGILPVDRQAEPGSGEIASSSRPAVSGKQKYMTSGASIQNTVSQRTATQCDPVLR